MKSSVVVLFLCLVALPLNAFASKTHVARNGETLQSISRKYQVSVDELKAVNNISSNRLAKGDKIIIPTAKATVENCSTYKVVAGDTLPKIAKKTGVKMADLRRFNGIKGNKLKLGRVLQLTGTAVASCDVPAAKPANDRLKMVSKELLNEQEYSDTLSELTEIDSDKPVDLAKKMEDRNKTGVTELKKSAYTFLGARYRFGGNSRNALDCSSFTQQVFREQNVTLPRTAREQFRVGDVVARGDLQKGDLVFFQTYARFPSHVGIYLGNRKMIHASSRDRKVVISSMDTPYYTSRFLGARRIGKINPESFNISELLVGIEEEKDGDAALNNHLGLGLPEDFPN
jgi:LysM repeat protein